MQQDSGLDAIITAFIRYSEFSSIKYEAARNIIKIETALKGSLLPQQKISIINTICQALTLYYRITKVKPTLSELDIIQPEGITILRLFRDVDTVSEEEMELFVLLLRQNYPNSLLKDDNNLMSQQFIQQDMKNVVLKKIKRGQKYNNIFAYRDGGRVFVFNK